MSSITVCHVMDYGAPTSGSFIPALVSLANAVRARGDRFAVIATKVTNATWPEALELAGVELHLIERNDKELISHLRELKPAIVHSHFTTYDLATLSAFPGTRIFWHAHSYRDDHLPLIRARGFLKHCILGRRVEGLVAVSEQVGKSISAPWYGPSKRVRIVQNGIDTEYFRLPAAGERTAARQQFGIADSDRIVLFFERVAYKGGATVRNALPLLNDYRLLVVGGTLEARARFGTAPRVISLDRVADVRQLYWTADVFVFASNHEEAFGYVIAEALACGVPIAASDIPIVREICDDAESVIRFPVGDAPAMAQAIKTAFGRNGIAARERMAAKFSLPRWTEEMLGLYYSV